MMLKTDAQTRRAGEGGEAAELPRAVSPTRLRRRERRAAAARQRTLFETLLPMDSAGYVLADEFFTGIGAAPGSSRGESIRPGDLVELADETRRAGWQWARVERILLKAGRAWVDVTKLVRGRADQVYQGGRFLLQVGGPPVREGKGSRVHRIRKARTAKTEDSRS